MTFSAPPYKFLRRWKVYIFQNYFTITHYTGIFNKLTSWYSVAKIANKLQSSYISSRSVNTLKGSKTLPGRAWKWWRNTSTSILVNLSLTELTLNNWAAHYLHKQCQKCGWFLHFPWPCPRSGAVQLSVCSAHRVMKADRRNGGKVPHINNMGLGRSVRSASSSCLFTPGEYPCPYHYCDTCSPIWLDLRTCFKSLTRRSMRSFSKLLWWHNNPRWIWRMRLLEYTHLDWSLHLPHEAVY